MGTGEGGAGAEAETSAAGEDEEDAGILARRSAGILDAFSEDEIDEDDVGGYAYDIAFVVDSLTSKAFALVGVFMAVMAATFFVLYRGGIGELSKQFVSRMPSEFAAEQVSIVTLHPVEALIFMIKVSVIAGVVATLPLVLYYAWPALKERGLARGDRRVLLLWGGTLLFGLTVGSIVGFIYVAPAVISWLAADVLGANMIIAYRISNYGWMIFFLTAGLGILAVIPVSMFLFHRGNIVPYSVMRNRWREFTIAVLSMGAFLSPRGVFTMFLLGIPVVATYLAGLGILWVYTLGGRRTFEPAEGAD
jgi:sec-independent protein translocase protein TatC